MRRIARGLTGLIIVVASLTASSPASACSAPLRHLTVTPATVRAGSTVEVAGESMWDIDPTPPTTTSTTGPPWEPECEPLVPGGPVELRFVQGATVVTLATAQPDEAQRLVATVVVPASARVGVARIEAVADYIGYEVFAELVVVGDPPRVEPRYAG
jgi:endonuclease YncB( thermonuclease family)